MKVTYKEISDASGVSEGKVKTDVRRSKLDTEDLRSVCGYVMANLLLCGIERVSGMVKAEAIIPAEGSGVTWNPATGEIYSLDEPVIVMGSEIESRFNDFEEMVIGRIMGSGKSRKVAENQIKAMREHVGVDRLGEDHMEELGL